MPRSPLSLAALATVAVPGLDAFDVRRPAHQSGDVDSAIVIDAAGGRWVVRAPATPAAGAALEAEVALLTTLAVHVDSGALPFDVPRPAGYAHLPEGGRAVVHPQLPGRPLRLEHLGPGPGLAASVGRALAALHELPVEAVDDAGLPVYDAEAYRRRRLAEVDEAAKTGRVPPTLLRRWERALEDVSSWRFQPTVVHGDLSAEHVLCRDDQVTAVLGWGEAKVADPADDLAWLLVAAPQEAIDPILEAYTLRRTETPDRHLADRALLAGELALARWLLHGVRTQDEEVIADATAMLVELDEHTSEPEPAPTPGAAVRQNAGLDGAEWDGTESDGTESDGTESDGTESDGAETDEAAPDGTGSDGAETDGPDAEDGEPESDEPRPAEPDVAGPDADEPDADPSRSDDAPGR